MNIPSNLLVHTVDVKPRTGSGAYGDTYGTVFPLPCFAEGKRRWVRDTAGAQVVSSLTLYASPGKAALVPAGSVVTWNGKPCQVIESTEHDDGNLGAPQHSEVVCA